MQAFHDPLSAFTAQTVIPAQTNKPKFVEGTVYQLSRALYEIHTLHESQPSFAIQETLQRMSDNEDRKVLLLAARSRSEALARKRMMIIHSGKAQPQQKLTVFEQAQLLAQQEIKALKSKLKAKVQKAKVESAEPTTPVKEKSDTLIIFKTQAKGMISHIALLERQVEEASYTPKQIEDATARLKRIKSMDQQTDESEDTVPQMANIWKQLAQALLLQKLAPKTKDGTPVSYEAVPTTSKEPIATVWRFECGRLNRLKMGDAETVRTFASRCRSEARYCTWLGTLHVLENGDPKFSSQTAIFSQMENDIDLQLFTVLSAVVPAAYAFMRSTVERDSLPGQKFAALCVAIEGEADFMREHAPKSATVSFLDTSREHMASVALQSRISKDPRGEPLKENQTESYSKMVSTEYGMRAKRKKRKESDKGESEGEEHEEATAKEGVMALLPDNNPHFEHLWNRVLNLEASNSVLAVTPKRATTLVCFDFRKRGKCSRGDKCDFVHDSQSSQTPEREGRKVKATSRSPPPRFSEGLGRPRSHSPRRKSRSPLRSNTQPRRERSRSPRREYPRGEYRERNRPTHHGGKGGNGGKGGKGGRGNKGGDRVVHEMPHSPPNGHTCLNMWHQSYCDNKQCRLGHGISAENTTTRCSHYKQGKWCHFLWTPAGCNSYHGKRKND